MPLTLEKYAEMLDLRKEPRPAGPDPKCFASVKPHVKRLPQVRSVVYSGYGTLLLIQGGTLHFLNPDPVMRRISLEKTIQEFKMWASMSRKPGEPSEYMATVFGQIQDGLMMQYAQQKDVELPIEKIWEGIVARLQQKDYVYEAGTYGDVPEFAKKISYFYLMASQGVSAFPDAYTTFAGLKTAGILQGIHANWQCNGPVQLLRTLSTQGSITKLADFFDPDLTLISSTMGAKKQSDRGVAPLVKALGTKSLTPQEVLYLGSDIEADIIPAKRRGFRTALLLADRNSAVCKPEQLKDDKTRPDLLLTSLVQLAAVFSKPVA